MNGLVQHINEMRLREDVAQCEDRLRWMILHREAVAAELAKTDEGIRQESRKYADLQGITLMPTYSQLRRQLVAVGENTS